MQRKSLLRLGCFSLVCVLVMARFLPGKLAIFAGMADVGWSWAIDIAAARHFVFGRNIIFTYGPYAPVVTRLYLPELRWIMLGGSALLGTAFAAGLCALGRPIPAMLAVLVLPLAQTIDGLAFALPLPTLLLCADATRTRRLTPGAIVAILAVLPALALLPLMKGSLLAVTLTSVAGLCGLLWCAGQRRFACVLPVAVAVVLVVLWCAAGQPIGGLPGYFAATLQIISGYNDAMAAGFSVGEPLAALIACLIFLALLASRAPALQRNHVLQRTGALWLCLSAATILFVLLKAAFVRQDPGHTAVVITGLGMMFAVLASRLSWRPALVAGGLALLLMAAPLPGADGIGSVYYRMTAGRVADARSLYRLLAEPAEVAAEQARAISAVRGLPWHPAGTADIYSSGQARLFAAELRWSPRPVIQSYSAYTPVLERLNADHLLGASAPDNVFFNVGTIDGHLPALEDGLSWPALLSRYEPVSYDAASDLIWLRRAQPIAKLATPGLVAERGEALLGQSVPVPALPRATDAVWATIDLQPSLAGRVAGVFWKAPTLSITLGFADGRRRDYRAIPAMARAGFVLSPWVGSTRDFLRLRAAVNGERAPQPRPVSISVDAPAFGHWAWHRRYRVTFAPLALPAMTGMPTMLSVPAPVPVAAAPPAPPRACFLDEIDGGKVPPILNAAGPLDLTGWALFDPETGTQADAIEFALQDQNGQIYAVPTLPVARFDLMPEFHLANADRAGFVTLADVSHMPPGRYRLLTLARRDGITNSCIITKTSLVIPKPQ